jgi:hypothetical protein
VSEELQCVVRVHRGLGGHWAWRCGGPGGEPRAGSDIADHCPCVCVCLFGRASRRLFTILVHGVVGWWGGGVVGWWGGWV